MRLTLFILSLAFSSCLYSQSLPFSKIVHYDVDQLVEAKFKYNKTKNQQTLANSSGLSAFSTFGVPSDSRGKNDSYKITIQDAEVGVSYVKIEFYMDDMYHYLLKWAKENGANLVETSSGRLTKSVFDYQDYKVELTRYNNSQKFTENSSPNIEKTVDRSYNTYTYTIFTGAAPYSEWHNKEAAKAARQEAKGKKKLDMGDLM